MEKLVVCIMGQDCEKFIDMCLDSAKTADAIVYCDGGSSDKTLDIVDKFIIQNQKGKTIDESEKSVILERPYDQEDKQMNGKQRNFYLNYLKENYPNYWVLCLDADEIVEDLSKIREFINRAPKGLYSPKMRHLIGDLGHEDSTVKDHWVPNRLFHISCAGVYPEVEHPVLQPINQGIQQSGTDCTTIWHLAYIPNLWEIKKRYDNHMKKSNMHTPEFLKDWYYKHLFGQYPRTQIDLRDLPKQLLDKFGIDKDEFYFKDRGIEIKHSLMVKQWNDYFRPDSVLDLGCGRGVYMYFWKWYVEKVIGVELSNWAVKNAFTSGIREGSCTEKGMYSEVDLITAIDVLEHLTDTELISTLKNMSEFGKRFIFSIPFIGDPNLDNDKTHKQFRTREEWIKIIELYGIKIIETPSDWLFAPQILVGEIHKV